MDWGSQKPPKQVAPVRLWQCHVCRQDTGEYSSVAVTVMHPVFTSPETGDVDPALSKHKAVCAACLARGKVTDVF